MVKLTEHFSDADVLRMVVPHHGRKRHQDQGTQRAAGRHGVGLDCRHSHSPFPDGTALWNGYPLLRWDTGGYLARWYEGYLVPSRSTVFGLYLHVGENSDFWINLGVKALATLWILQLSLRVSILPSRSGC